MKRSAIAIVTALAVSTLAALAQDAGGPPPGGGGPGGPGGGGPGGEQRRPLPPLITALDANGDGVIDEKEIANAPAALKKLDKNGDGKLTREEIMPPRPGGQGGPEGRGGDRQGGQRPGGGGEGQSNRQRPASE